MGTPAESLKHYPAYSGHSKQLRAFYGELGALEQQFDQLKPELDVAVFDRHTGMEGYVVVWNTINDPNSSLGLAGKGGTRITPQVTRDEVRMLARIMALKNAAAGLPLGGAKSGLRADPAAENFEATYRSFVSALKPVLRENGGKFGGFGFDIGARPEHALWACDELGSTRSFTGKPVAMGGTDYDREGIAGLGVATAAKQALLIDDEDLTQTTFAVQGLGAMGGAVLRYFGTYGAFPRAISDPRIGGAYIISNGVAREVTDRIITQNFEGAKTLLQQAACQCLALEDILYQDVDVLFPCAVQDVITEKNVKKIQARYIAEGANNPCSEQARTLLYGRGVTVIPDYIANPGGIIAAYVEMTSQITPEENGRTKQNVYDAKKLTVEKISDNVTRMMETARALDIQPTHAGKLMALRNIFGA